MFFAGSRYQQNTGLHRAMWNRNGSPQEGSICLDMMTMEVSMNHSDLKSKVRRNYKSTITEKQQ